jgi:molecular chaperone Hsp33
VASSFPTGLAVPETHVDHAVGFTIPQRHARGRIVRLGPVLDAILSNHDYPPVIARVLGEALVLGALLGTTLKDAAGQLTIQAQAEGGAIELLVVDYRDGELRGYVRHDAAKLAEVPADPSLAALFGQGYLAITFDQAVTGERYQGIVPLEGGSLAEAVEHYFAQSEQIPSLVRVGFADLGAAGHVAGGILLQHLAEGEEGRERLHTRLDHPEWAHVATLGGTLSTAELVDQGLALDRILWRLFNEEAEIRVSSTSSFRRGCRCSAEHVRSVLARFPADERAAMADDAGMIQVDCAFCARTVAVPLAALG